MNLQTLIQRSAASLSAAGVAFGHGTDNAHDEAAWLVLWRLGLPLDTQIAEPAALNPSEGLHAPLEELSTEQIQACERLIDERIRTRKPAAYLTQEAWLQGIAFYIDERSIVPRSFIAELLTDGSLDYWLSEQSTQFLDLCTGNGSLAVLAALTYPEIQVLGADISEQALQVARINVEKHHLEERIHLQPSDGLTSIAGKFDCILCNPPYVCHASMQELPAEYLAEPLLALDGGSDGMNFVRQLLHDLPAHMNDKAILVLEIGNERAHFENAFAKLQAIWLETSAGEDQVLLITREALVAYLQST